MYKLKPRDTWALMLIASNDNERKNDERETKTPG